VRQLPASRKLKQYQLAYKMQKNAVGTPAHKANGAINETGLAAFWRSPILQKQSAFIKKSLFIILIPVWHKTC
jgi:hypothetical protein